jgi:hypothetical protein
MRRSFVAAASALTVIAAGYGLWEWTRSMGRDALEDFALAGQKCSKESCDAERELITTITTKMIGMPAAQLEWCFGVDKWAETPVYRGAWLQSILIDAMYLPCGAISETAEQTSPPAAP